jgi:molecular chaperone DnaK
MRQMQSARDRLQAASHKLAEAMYKAATPPPPGDAGAQAAGESQQQKKKDDGVIDAEYVDVDEKK